ncbi:MAG: hypothetical protein Q8L88_00585 [Bacteroidota bacterium]|nr:hypothetical protein [Bacteroidota bacterium]
MATPNQFSPIKVITSLSGFNTICPENEYRILKAGEYPPEIPEGLASKFNHMYCASSGFQNSVVYVFTGVRVDGDAVDEHPFVVSFDKKTGDVEGGLLHHGDWEGRTTPISEKMKYHINESGIQSYFPFIQLPHEQGPIQELMDTSLSAAFWASVGAIEEKDDESIKS